MSLSFRDKMQAVNTFLMAVLGCAIIVRTAAAAGPPQAYLMGAMFLAYAGYRARHIIRALRAGRSSP
jgi:hypothetical protein